MEVDPAFAYTVLTALFLAGTVWGATKAALNGTKQRVQIIHEELREHIHDEHNADMETHERIARMEAKLDLLISDFHK
jgi:hypothetical protein